MRSGIKFVELVNEITKIGYDWHKESILENTQRNAPCIDKSLRDIEPDERPCLVISAGPSLYRQNILKRIQGFKGTVVATDGAYIQCLRSGVIPDYVVTLDPHPTRMVRWFGDPDFYLNSKEDDYFERQDLDVEFRKDAEATNTKNYDLVTKFASKSRFIVSTTSPTNVVSRLLDMGVVPYWFVPLVDNPKSGSSLTRNMCEHTNIPAMNTGGTVGTASWVFAHTRLQSENIAVVGTDFGYSMDTPFDKTQSWNMLKEQPNYHDLYPHYTGFWGESYTDPTYWYYRQGFLDLLESSKSRVINCSGEGLFFGKRVGCMELEQWLAFTA